MSRKIGKAMLPYTQRRDAFIQSVMEGYHSITHPIANFLCCGCALCGVLTASLQRCPSLVLQVAGDQLLQQYPAATQQLPQHHPPHRQISVLRVVPCALFFWGRPVHKPACGASMRPCLAGSL